MVFVAPNPQKEPKYLAIIKPLDPFVWLLLICSWAATSVVFVILAKIEEKVSGFHQATSDEKAGSFIHT